MEYLAVGNNTKTKKSDKHDEYITAIMYLSPADSVRGINVCPMAKTAKCISACLNYAGRGQTNAVQKGRQRKTAAFRDDQTAFVDVLANDIRIAKNRATRLGKKLAVRLNGTSDIAWENQKGTNGLTLMEMYPDVQFYDYTKLPKRKVPSNYHLTASYSEADASYAATVKKTKHNIAVVFDRALPKTFLGRPVVNGDNDDLRFLDPKGVVVGLIAKGKAKKDDTGFVIKLVEVA